MHRLAFEIVFVILFIFIIHISYSSSVSFVYQQYSFVYQQYSFDSGGEGGMGEGGRKGEFGFQL